MSDRQRALFGVLAWFFSMRRQGPVRSADSTPRLGCVARSAGERRRSWQRWHERRPRDLLTVVTVECSGSPLHERNPRENPAAPACVGVDRRGGRAARRRRPRWSARWRLASRPRPVCSSRGSFADRVRATPAYECSSPRALTAPHPAGCCWPRIPRGQRDRRSSAAARTAYRRERLLATRRES